MTADYHLIRLEPYDDVVSIRDRLTAIESGRVLLVWPRSGAVLHRQLDLLLIQRQATRQTLRLALVTADQVVIDHANDLNISVFSSVQAARRGRWKKPRDKVFTLVARDRSVQAELAERVSRLRGGGAPTLWGRLTRWGMFLLLLLALAAGFIIATPNATVTITPDSRQVYERVEIIADPALVDIDIENRQMPATVISLETTSQVTIPSSGVEEGGESQAQGLVTFTNLSSDPVLIPLGTVVATSETFPIRFETQIETILPAGPDATVQVPIQALAEYSGGVGNVSPGTINRIESSLTDQVTVTNLNATYGGAAQERRTVTAGDHAYLLQVGRDEAIRHAEDLLLLQIGGDQFLVPGSVVIVQERPEWTNYNPPLVGDVSESVSLNLQVQVQAVVVDERQARQVAYAGLGPQIQPGWEVAPDELIFTRGEILRIEPTGRVTFTMIVEGESVVSVDEDQVRDLIQGIPQDEAARRLQGNLLLNPDYPPEIDIWPPWYGRLPILPIRITVEVRSR
jgi:hypothetical protein